MCKEECLKAQYKDASINNLKHFEKVKICEICEQPYIAKSPTSRWCKTCIPNKKARTIFERYGLLQKEFEKLKAENNGICPICNERKAEVIDHDHETGQVRGFICSKCNLGLYFIENIELKKKMEQYLKKKR